MKFNFRDMKSINYKSRNETIKELNILDHRNQNSFDELTKLAASICGTKYSAITVIDDDKQWFKSTYGFELKETPASHSICENLIKKHTAGIYIPNLEKDKKFKNHESLTIYNTRFYAGYPIKTKSNFIIGGFCVLDNEPRELEKNQLEYLKILAKQAENIIKLNIEEYKKNITRNRLSNWVEAFHGVQKKSKLGYLYIDKIERNIIWGKNNNSFFGNTEENELTYNIFLGGNFNKFQNGLNTILELIHQVFLENKEETYEEEIFLKELNKSLTIIISNEPKTLTTIILDSTKSYFLKEHLYSYKSMMNEVEKISKIGGFEYYVENDHVKLTNNSYKIFELDKKNKVKLKDLLKYYDEKSRYEALKDIQYAIQNKIPYSNIRKIKIRSGIEKIFKISLNPNIQNNKVKSLIGSIRDITEEFLLEEELRKSKIEAEKSASFFRSIVENNQFFVAIINNRNKVEYCNKYFKDYLIQRLEIDETNLTTTIERKFLSVLYNSNEFISGKNYEFRITEQGKDNRKFTILWNASFIDNQFNSDNLIIFIGIDITEIEENKNQINQLVDLASHQSKALLEFNNIISHNLRGEVSNLHGLQSLMELVSSPEEKTLYFNLIKQCTRNIDDILHQLNKFTTLGLSEPVLLEPVSLADLISRLSRSISLRNPGIDINFILTVNPDLILLSSNDYLERIFTALISNCIDFRSPKRDLLIRIKSEQVDKSSVEVQIEDNGIGMDLTGGDDKLFRINHALHRISGKKGFGLFFVKKLIDILNGSIKISSTLDEGTIVTLKFPNNEI